MIIFDECYKNHKLENHDAYVRPNRLIFLIKKLFNNYFL